ncbi:MAG: outer membrane protein assembly factor BamE [Woeseia sp.]
MATRTCGNYRDAGREGMMRGYYTRMITALHRKAANRPRSGALQVEDLQRCVPATHTSRAKCRRPERATTNADAKSQITVRKLLIVFLILFTLPIASSCVYQASLSQGNLLKQEDLDQLKVGMTRSQVRFLLGTPMIDDPFHEERWDYVYYLRVGRDKATFKRWVSIYFDGDTVRDIVDDQELKPDL